MANIDKNKIIKIYGVTLADDGYRTDSYGHGTDKIIIERKEVWVQYVNYHIEHLIALIKQQGLNKIFLKKLK